MQLQGVRIPVSYDKAKVVALTGTPGVGKTSVAKILSKKGYKVLSFNEIAKNLGCIIDYEDDCYVVDIEKLKRKFNPEGFLIVDGHLSHHIADVAIVLRCNPLILKERLLSRGWNINKVMENVEAELIDTILIECLETCKEVYEIDTSDKSVEEVAKIVTSILKGNAKDYVPGKIDWISKLGDRIDEVIRR